MKYVRDDAQPAAEHSRGKGRGAASGAATPQTDQAAQSGGATEKPKSKAQLEMEEARRKKLERKQKQREQQDKQQGKQQGSAKESAGASAGKASGADAIAEAKRKKAEAKERQRQQQAKQQADQQAAQRKPAEPAPEVTDSPKVALPTDLSSAKAWAVYLRKVAVRYFRRIPVTLGIIALIWAVSGGFAFHADRLRTALGFGVTDTSASSALTSGFATSSVSGAVFATVALLTLGAMCEVVLGSRKYAVSLLGMQVLGVVLGAIGATGLNLIGAYWGTTLAAERVLTPLTWVFGLSVAVSARLSVLWRRRIRALVITLTITMVMYSGSLADVARLAAVLFGLVVGVWVAGGRISLRRSSIRESRILIALVAFAVFLGPLFAGLNPDYSGPLAPVGFLLDPKLSADQAAVLCEIDANSKLCRHAMWHLRSTGLGPWLANMMPLLVMAVIATGLARGRRAAWWAAVVAQVTSVVAVTIQIKHFLYKVSLTDWFLTAAVLAVPWFVVLVTLLFTRQVFNVGGSRPANLRFLRRGLVLLAGTAVVWVVAAWLLRTKFQPNATFTQILQVLPLRYIPPSVAKYATWGILPSSSLTWDLMQWVCIIFWVGIAVLLYVTLLDVRDTSDERHLAQARKLRDRGSGDHLSHMTLWEDNRYWFADRDRGYVAYRAYSGVAVTLGEPVVVDADSREIADEFEEYARSQGLTVAWYSVRDGFAAHRAEHGQHSVTVAVESVIRTDQPVKFTGKKFQDVRTARNRAEREGIRSEWTTWADCGVAVREQIIALSEEWVADKALPEMGFTLGGLQELDDPEVGLMLALDDRGKVHGVTSWLPVVEEGKLVGRTLDFMRRDAEGFHTVVEFLIAESVLKAHDDGIQWVSLSGAPLATSAPEGSALDTILERTGALMEPLYGFRSLAAFKKKFQPEHHDWVLSYPDELSLPSIGVAVSRAYLPDVEFGQLAQAARQLMGRKREAQEVEAISKAEAHR